MRLLTLITVLVAGCQLSPPPLWVTIALDPSKTERSAISAPTGNYTAISGMDAFFVSVAGSDVEPNVNSQKVWGLAASCFGAVSRVVSASDLFNGVSLNVTPGDGRTIRIIGIKQSSRCVNCQTVEEIASYADLDNSALYVIGETTTSLRAGSVIDITNTYNSVMAKNYLDDCNVMSLTVSVSGIGNVKSQITTTTGNNSGIAIDCGNGGSVCSTTFPKNSAVVLTSTAGTNYTFDGWGEGCSGSASSCTLTLGTSKTVTASYAGPSVVTASPTGAGSGTIMMSTTSGTSSCSWNGSSASNCSLNVLKGNAVTLMGTASAGSTFLGWSGGTCFGTPSCTFTPTADTTVNATFVVNPVLLITGAGTGGMGSVSFTPSAEACNPVTNGSSCSRQLTAGTVTITAAAVMGSFGGFSGAGCTTSPCTFTLSGDTTITATFNNP